MDLLIIRHAIAEDRDEFAATGRPDSQRPLTAEGRKKMKRASQGLRVLVPHLDAIATSPWTRAHETAEIVGQAYGATELTVLRELQSDTPLPDLEERLATFNAAVVALVGHETHLSRTISWLIGGREDAGIELKKGGACLLHFPRKFGAGRGVLQWLLTPRQLRGLS